MTAVSNRGMSVRSKFAARSVALALLAILSNGCSKTESKSLAPPASAVTIRPTPTLEQQRMCADQAKKAFDEFDKSPEPAGYKTVTPASYTDHFDVSTTTCYVETINSWTTDRGSTFCNGKTVSDAFEGHVYASYIWCSDKKKKYWEVAPLICTVKTRQLAETNCHSGDEFDKFVAEHFGTEE